MRQQRISHMAGAALSVLFLSGLAACGGEDDGSQAITIRVFAAASLRTTFEDLGETFEDENDGVEVEFNFAGSSDLAAQIQQGAAVDVFASADTANMDKLVGDGLLGEDPEVFAANTLQIAVPEENPAGVAGLADLTRRDVALVVCAPVVPCGAAADRVEEAAGLEFQPVSEEQSVTDVLNKVITGEADAGLVYVTDVRAAGDKVEGVPFPESSSAVNDYPIATLAAGEHRDLARAFMDLVLGETGQGVLAEAGFASP